jgi:AhpD family alkylhydroperoxidase
VQFDKATDTQRELLAMTRKEYKMIPNMYRAMANNPVLLKSYMDAYKGFRTQCNFSSVEQEIVFLTISVENNCSYCMAAHSIIADLVSKVPPNIEYSDAS